MRSNEAFLFAVVSCSRAASRRIARVAAASALVSRTDADRINQTDRVVRQRQERHLRQRATRKSLQLTRTARTNSLITRRITRMACALLTALLRFDWQTIHRGKKMFHRDGLFTKKDEELRKDVKATPA